MRLVVADLTIKMDLRTPQEWYVSSCEDDFCNCFLYCRPFITMNYNDGEDWKRFTSWLNKDGRLYEKITLETLRDRIDEFISSR